MLPEPDVRQEIDSRHPVIRLSALFDRDSMTPMDSQDGSGVRTARGLVEGEKVLAYCTDARVMGGSMTTEGCRRIVDMIETAVAEGLPVVGLWHSGGARLAEGV